MRCGVRRCRVGVWASGVVLLAGLVGAQRMSGQAAAQAPKGVLGFAVATVKPSRSTGWRMFFTTDGFLAQGVTLQQLVGEAFAAYHGDSVTGGPAWAATEKFDVEARLDAEEVPAFRELSLTERRAMLQRLLAARFKVVVRRETHTIHGEAIVVDKNGPKLTAGNPAKGTIGGVKGYDCSWLGRGAVRGEARATNCSMDDLSEQLTGIAADKVVDQTGLPGRYDFELRWTPERPARVVPGAVAADDEGGYPPLESALRQQLGLKLVPAEVPVNVYVLERAEEPEAN